MNFDFSDEQKHLKQEVARFLDHHVSLTSVLELLTGNDRQYENTLWEQISAQGWPGVAIPECYGGVGLSCIELCAIAEELGRANAPAPFASSIYFFAEAVLMEGSEAQKSSILPKVASGELIGCFAITEQVGQLSSSSISCRAKNNRLTGQKVPVIDGDKAHMAVVLAKGELGLSCYLVNLDLVDRESEAMIDPSRSGARLRFDETQAELLGKAGEGYEIVQRVLERAAVYLAFEQLGGAERCMDLSKEIAQTRFAFGRAIGSFQAIKHKLAHMYIKIELARSHAYFGACALLENSTDLSLAASAARISATKASWYCAKETIQTYGGMGVTWDGDPHLFYRRACHLALAGESIVYWKSVLAKHLAKNIA